MASYKKIILGFGILHIAVIVFILLFIFQNIIDLQLPKSAASASFEIKKSFIRLYEGKVNRNSDDMEYQRFYLFILSMLAIFPFIFFSTIVVKKLKKYRRKQAELIGANKNKDLFLSIISHDLRTPAQQMIALSELIVKGKQLEPEEYIKINSLMNICAKKHYELLNNILDWSTSQYHGVQLPKSAFSLYDLIEEEVFNQKEKVDEKKIQIRNSIKKDTYITSNQNLVRTVVRNLLNNALKFTHPGGSIEFTSHFHDNRKSVSIEIKDSGVGIKEETYKNLFDLKYIRSMRGSNKEVGSGIGLILCKEILEKLKGKIEVITKENEGSRFIIKLPNR